MEVESLDFRRVQYYSKSEKLKTTLAGESRQACETGPQTSEFSWRPTASKGRVKHKRERIIKFMKMKPRGIRKCHIVSKNCSENTDIEFSPSVPG